jgi:hypothetical protein
MKYEDCAVNYRAINESLYSAHPKLGGPVKVFNDLHHQVAEYSITTGLIEWHRTLPPSQRAEAEKWLADHYPVAVGV